MPRAKRETKGFTVNDYATFGKFITDIVMKREEKPRNLGELAARLGDAVSVSPGSEGKCILFQSMEDNSDVCVMYLPPERLVRRAEQRFASPTCDVRQDYPTPEYYYDNPPRSCLEMFYARTGDYTTGECE